MVGRCPKAVNQYKDRTLVASLDVMHAARRRLAWELEVEIVPACTAKQAKLTIMTQ